jgi:hypothetical protein
VNSTASGVTFCNYTPHELLVWLHEDGTTTELPQQGLARCEETSNPDGSWDNAGRLPRLRVGYGDVHGLPDPAEAVVYVVSQLVVWALPGRTDLGYPHDLRRDTGGTVIGFRYLAVPERSAGGQ